MMLALVGVLKSRWLFVSLGSFAYWLAASSLRPLVPLHISALGGSTTDVAIAVMVQAAAPLAVAALVGRWVDLTSARLVLQAGSLMMAGVGALYSLSTGIGQIYVLQALNGLAELAVWVALQAYITQITDPTSRHQHLAVFGFVWGLGLTLGPWLGSVLYETIGFSALGYSYGLGGVVSLVAAWCSPRIGRPSTQLRAAPGPDEHESHTTPPDPLPAGWRTQLRTGYVLTGIGAFFNSLRQSYFPILLHEQGVSVSRIGLVLTVMGFASLVIRLPLAALCRYFGTTPTVVAGTYGALLIMAATPFVGTGYGLLLAAALMGASYGVNPPLTVELLAASSTAGQRGKVMARRVISNRVAALIQPMAFSAIAGTIGLVGAFPLIGTSVVGLGLAGQAALHRGALKGGEGDAA